MSAAPGVGTTLASLHDVWRGRRNQQFLDRGRSRFARGTVLILGFDVAVTALLAAAGYPTWRIAVVAAAIGAQLAAVWMVLRWSTRTGRVERGAMLANLCGVTLATVLIALTGGLNSPFTPALPALVIPISLIVGPGLELRTMLISLAAVVALLAAAPIEVTGPALPLGYRAGLSVISLGWTTITVLGWMGSAARDAAQTVSDLREERLSTAEGQLRRLQSVGAKVAHELKNPLAAVKGLVQLIVRSPDSERTPERLKVVEGEIARMETILHQYLTFSRPLEDLQPRPILLLDVVDDVLSVLAGRAEQAEVELQRSEAQTPTQIAADPRRLKEALLNLVANALEATPARGRVNVAVEPDAGGARLLITDTGRGISPENMAKVGTSFFTTRDSGTGLGLVLARNVIEQHGGSLVIASEHGHGTTVTVRLPAAPPADAGKLPGKAPGKEPGKEPGQDTGKAPGKEPGKEIDGQSPAGR